MGASKINSENPVCLPGPRLYGRTAVRILSRVGSNLVMMATSRISRVGDRQRVDVLRRSFFSMAKEKTRALDLDAKAQAALDEARAMPQGPERTAALKKAGILRKAADSHGITYAKRGRPRKI